MYYIIDLINFIVLRGPFITYEQAHNAKVVCSLRIDGKTLAIVKVTDNDW